MQYQLSPQEKQAFHRDGYLIRRGFFSPQETDLLYQLSIDETVIGNSMDFNDQSGNRTRLTLWFTPGDDSFGMMSRSERMVDAVAVLLPIKKVADGQLLESRVKKLEGADFLSKEKEITLHVK